MKKVLQFVNDWMLPLAIITGISIAVAFHCIGESAAVAERHFATFAKAVQPFIVGVMLFLQFVKVSPHDLRFRKYHLYLLLFQALFFAASAVLALSVSDAGLKILAECAMLCFACPTAAAAGVITDKLGGSLSNTVSYVVLVNIMAAVAIPLVVPVVNPSSHISFWSGCGAICMRTFPMLVLPLLLAWLVRYTWHKLQHRLMRYTWWAFYCWGISLTLAIYLATRALLASDISILTAIEIAAVSLFACLFQFLGGRLIGRKMGRVCEITAGQSLGQKNTGFFIWIGYSYLTPVTSIAGGFYSLWQNIVNSEELLQKRHHDAREAR